MSLPHTPETTWIYADSYCTDTKRHYGVGHTDEALLAYGRQVREAALEDAARLCDRRSEDGSPPQADQRLLAEYGIACAAAEQERILRIVYDECMACGAVGEQSWINIKSKARRPPLQGDRT